MKKVLFLQNIIYPIRHPFFEKLNSSKKIIPFVLFLSKTASNRKWHIDKKNIKYPYKISLNLVKKTFDSAFELVLNPFVLIDYFKIKHDILISIGWANPSNYILIFISILRRIPYYLWVESTLNEKTIKRKLMSPVIKYIVKHAKACIVPGSASKDYIYSFIKNKEIIILPNSINNIDFYSDRKKTNKKPLLLFVGRFSKEKNILFLLNSIKNLEKTKKFDLWLIGYGPQEEEIIKYIKKNKIKSVKKITYVNRKKLIEIYKRADIFILPSVREPWGFVINEAMASGLPILSSNKVGSSVDLVKNNLNGYTFDPYDHDDLELKLTELIDKPYKRFKMGKESIKIISSFTINKMVKKLYENI
jgi:glycosyltransferase involved in cell wall biosynthesis